MVDTIFAGFLSMHVFEVLHGIIRYQLTPGAVVRKKVSFFLACLDVIRDLGTSVQQYIVVFRLSAFRSCYGNHIASLFLPVRQPFSEQKLQCFFLSEKTSSLLSVSVSLIKQANTDTDIYRFRMLVHVFSVVHHFLSTNGWMTSLV